MLTRSIDLDPFDLTIEEKVFRYGKRICVGFAIVALTISGLDLMNVRSLENTAELIHESRLHYTDIPARILTGIRQISVLPQSSPSVTVAIPRDAILDTAKIAMRTPSAPAPITAPPEAAPAAITAAPVLTPRIAFAPPPPVKTAATPAEPDLARPEPSRSAGVMPDRAKPNNAVVEELAAARHIDAVELAMAAPTAIVDKPKATALAIPVPAAASSVPPVQLASVDAGALPTAIMPEATPMSLPMAAPIPLDMVPLPRVAPPLSPAQRLNLTGKDYAKAERCLANAVYWESRSEPVKGQEAVAQVVMNRVFSGFYPNDVCQVVYQNANRHLACQFTFACDGKRKVINERGSWARANRIAKQTLEGKIYVPAVAKSTHYHAAYVHPYWTREMRKLARYGIHTFYRPYAWGNGNEEPVWGSAALAQNTRKK